MILPKAALTVSRTLCTNHAPSSSTVDEDGERVSRLPLASAATFDVRRYRPNVLIDTAAASDGFPENDWQGRKQLGGDVSLAVTIPTMRRVMTTLAQGDLPQDRDTLRTIAANNRVDIPGWGTWACAADRERSLLNSSSVRSAAPNNVLRLLTRSGVRKPTTARSGPSSD